MHACVLSHVRLFATPRTVASQAPLSTGFPGKNIEVGCHALIQGNLPSPGDSADPGLKPPSPVSIYHRTTWEAPCDTSTVKPTNPGSKRLKIVPVSTPSERVFTQTQVLWLEILCFLEDAVSIFLVLHIYVL